MNIYWPYEKGIGMIHSIIRMKLEPDKQPEAIQLLCLIAERTRRKLGCLQCAVYKCVEDETMVMMEQLWKDQEKFYHYLNSKDSQKLLLVIEMAWTEPDIAFNTIIRTDGIEAVKKARSIIQQSGRKKQEDISA